MKMRPQVKTDSYINSDSNFCMIYSCVKLSNFNQKYLIITKKKLLNLETLSATLEVSRFHTTVQIISPIFYAKGYLIQTSIMSSIGPPLKKIQMDQCIS